MDRIEFVAKLAAEETKILNSKHPTRKIKDIEIGSGSALQLAPPQPIREYGRHIFDLNCSSLDSGRESSNNSTSLIVSSLEPVPRRLDPLSIRSDNQKQTSCNRYVEKGDDFASSPREFAQNKRSR